MTDLSGVGMPPPTMRLLGLLVIIGVLQAVASFNCPKEIMNQALLADPTDCRRYYHCLTDGRSFRKSCPHGLVFEGKTKVCVWDSSRSCAPHMLEAADGDNVIASVAKAASSTSKAATTTDRKTTTTSERTTTTTTKKTTTTSKATSAAPVKEQTTKTTNDETTTVDFSTETSSENVTVSSNTTDMRAGENPTNDENDKTETSTSATEGSTRSFKAKKDIPKHSVLKRSPFAEDNRIDGASEKITCTSAFAYVTDPDNCHTFYHCNNWRPFQKRCPPGLFFDSQNLVCNWPHNVNCIEGYRARSLYSFNNLRRRVRPEDNIKKVKVIDSTTEKIPFLETIENDVKKIRYEEESELTTAQVTARSFDRYEEKYTEEKYPEEKYPEEKYSEEKYPEEKYPEEKYPEEKYPESPFSPNYPTRQHTYAPDSTTAEPTTGELTTTTTTTSAPSTSTESYAYETRPFESRSTWKDWNFDLFYTNSDKQDSELDKLELFSNGKKVQSENKDDDFMSTYDMYDYKSSTPTSDISSSSMPSTSDMWEEVSRDNEDTTTHWETAESDAPSTTEEPLSSSSDSSEETTSSFPATSTSDYQYTDDNDNMISTGTEFDSKTSEKSYDEMTTVHEEVSSRASSFDYGSDEERERNHPRKLQHDSPVPSNPFMTADRIGANQQSMYARDYAPVEDVEIEKFMMKMLNDAMQSKHMVARQASEEYPDNLVDGSYDKKKKSKESEMGGSDALDKWAISDKEGKKTKGTLVEETTESEAEEVESSGEVENTAVDTENQITNLIMKDEAKPAEPTKKDENVTQEHKTAENETKTEAETTNTTKDINATSYDNTTITTTTTKATTATEKPTKAETTTAKATESTTKVTETTTKVKAGEATVKTEESSNSTRDETTTVKAVPLLKDVSDLCSEKNCTSKVDNKTAVSITTEATTTQKVKTDSTTVKVDVTTKTEAANVTTKAPETNATTAKDDSKSVNATEKTEAVETTTVTTTNTTTKSDKKTSASIAKDAAGDVANEFLASSDNAISKEEKETLEIDDRHLSLSENATKSTSTEDKEHNNVTETENKLNVTAEESITEKINSTSSLNVTDDEQTTSAEESSDVTKSSSTSSPVSKLMSTISQAVEASSQSGKLLTGGSKGTTKKSFISLSDLIKWYLRHWRHYSRWRDSKEVRSSPQ